jgi:1-acyl-sn-glycerol-3-phosphate acyltransferase
LVNSVIPAIVRDFYNGDYATIGIFRALFGMGFVLGAITVTVLGNALRGEMAISLGLLGVSVGIAVLAGSTAIGLRPENLAWIGGVGIVIAGFFAVAVMTSVSSLLQRTVSNRYRGRVFGVHDLTSMAALLVATGALGIPQGTRIDRWVGWILAGVAIVAAVAGVLTLYVRLHRGVLRPWLTLAEHFNEFLARFWWRLERLGHSTVPRKGAVIVAANHTCAADPLFLTAAAPYRVFAFMIAQEFSRWPIVRFFVRVSECIPVTRGGQDTAAFKQAVRHLRAGKALGIFIEGKIVPPGETPVPRDGVAMLARVTGAQVIPAHISGTRFLPSVMRGLLARYHARVRFGKPVELNDLFTHAAGRESVETATQRIYAAIQALAPTAASGSKEWQRDDKP